MRFYHIISAFVVLADGLVGVLTLGFYRPYWDYRLMLWHSKKTMEKEIKKRVQ